MISIIIPAYNHGQELPKCLNSIFEQTFRDFEIIVVNDGSTDETEDVLNKYFRDAAVSCLYGGEIKIINQKNQGAPMARNNGFKESKGDYVIFLDADIVLRKDALEKMVGVLGNKIGYVYPNHKFGIKNFRLFPFDAEKLKQMNYIHTTALIKREAFPKDGFDPSLKKFQDWDLWLTMLENGYKGIWIDEFLFTVKQRKNGMSEWFPSFMYKISWAKFGIKIKAIEKYNYWREVVMKKHGLG